MMMKIVMHGKRGCWWVGGILKRGYDVVGADYTLFMSMINMFFTQNSSRKFGEEEEELKVLRCILRISQQT